MNKPYSLALHIFRRDLRLHDNTSLIQSLKSSFTVIPCFIFDKRQIENNPYKSDHCVQFMLNSLQELDNDLKRKKSKLYYFYGITEEIIRNLIKDLKVNALFINRDYTPFSRERDKKIENICKNLHIDFHRYGDALLHEPEEIFKMDHKPYTIFTPFLKKASELYVREPITNSFENFYQKSIPMEDKDIFQKLLKHKNSRIAVRGGRSEGLLLLKKIASLENYAEIRNFPSLNGTTHLSAHNKFGTISVREFYSAIVKNFHKKHPLINELFWRDFFTHIAFHFPHVFGEPFNSKYMNLRWNSNNKHFRAWCNGETGFPIVDAGMRELNTTGYMHNRVRMIVASFLTKDLRIDWRLGEKYFAQTLIDYDPAVNNGNWQWAASTGCDAQPYFRIFNPWLQQKKFDVDCLYIKKWIPELKDMPSHIIHRLDKISDKFIAHYPTPIINHNLEIEKTKIMYRMSLRE